MKRVLLTISALGVAALTTHAGAQNPRENNPQPKGALTDASIFVNAGHGWLGDNGRWRTQRGVSHGIIEDHSNAEAVHQYLLRYLWNAGARVYSARERDMNTNMVIVDAGGEGFESTGRWSERRAPKAWGGTELEVRVHDGVSTQTQHATATFAPELPEEGLYSVYAWYGQGSRRRGQSDGAFTIRHSGGETRIQQNLNHDGDTWKYLGTYHFDAGRNPERAAVFVENLGKNGNENTVVDAIRFGGGMGDYMDSGTISGKPRWEESGMYYVQFLGYDPSNDSRRFNSVSAMPMWAEWEMEEWERGKSMYIAWHTNASGGAGKSRGLFSFVYGPDDWADLTRFTGYPGGEELINLVHDSIINEINAAYDPNWRNGRKLTRWLGETNPRNNNDMPAALFEYGFHDNAEDAKDILNPQFRNIAARATYHGIVKFYAEHMEGFDNATFLPEPPTHLQATTSGSAVELRWQAPPFHEPGQGYLGHRATHYKVYRSTNGKGFDNGTETRTTSLRITDLAPGTTTFFRVTALNEGGESFPTEVLAVRSGEGARVLFVNGFDRLDGGLNIVEENKAQRGIVELMNSYNYSIQHAKAIEAAGYALDSASNEAIEAGSPRLDSYAAVVWALGQEKGADEVFSQRERELIRRYVQGGGNLLVSGSEVASSLAESEVGVQFLREVLHSELANDNAAINKASSIDDVLGATGAMAFNMGESKKIYPVQTPDVLRPVGDARVALAYGDGRIAGELRGAAIAGERDGKSRTLLIGFPFETMLDEAQRAQVMKSALGWLTGEGNAVANAQAGASERK